MNYRYYLLLIIICFPMLLCAQRESSKIRKGNRQYEKEQYTDAEVEYRRGLQVNSESFEAHYNLGNSPNRRNCLPRIKTKTDWLKRITTWATRSTDSNNLTAQ